MNVPPTALTAAAARAAHLIVDGPPTIFADTLAHVVLAERADELLSYHRRHGEHLVLAGARAQVTCRSRFAEDRLAEAITRGIEQYVILGAGLDTFAYRSELAARVRVFEVDHPSTQDWKRLRLDRVAPLGTVSYVPMDFETDDLARRLVASGYDPTVPGMVSWLGVTMYLTGDAIARTVAVIGGFASGTELVADYMLPPELRDAAGQTYVDLVAPGAAERGEPWLTFLGPAQMSAVVSASGFGQVEHAGQRGMVPAGVWDRTDALRPASLSQIVHARVGPSRST